MHITIKNLSYTYHPKSPFERQVLFDISLDIEDNKWIAIIGKTGSGKSTLVQHMNGLLRPTAGSIQIGDAIITADRKKKPLLYRDVGMVFQYPEHQLFEETVAKDIAYGPRNLGWPEEIVERRVRQALDLVGLDRVYLERSPFDLSGGQKRRVAIAGVLAMQPNILILDEPTAGLDPAGKRSIMNMLAEWKQAEERTVILITHQMDDVAEYADEALVLEHGRVKWHTDPLTLFTTHREELQELGLEVPLSVQLLEEINSKLASPLPYRSVKRQEIMKQLAEHIGRKGTLYESAN